MTRYLSRRRGYSPVSRLPPDPPEPAICTRSERCADCPYPTHGFICWQRDSDECLRTIMEKINQIKEVEEQT